MKGIQIRDSEPGDWASIEALYPAAFPDEDLLPVLRDLFQETPPVLSLVAIIESSVVGHVIFTPGHVAGNNENEKVALLAPLAVTPARQRTGIGSALVHDGFQRLRNAGVAHAYVLGDPAYYSRFGFEPETHVMPPYPLPTEWREAWQSTSLLDAERPSKGKLCLPQSWLQPALWTP